MGIVKKIHLGEIIKLCFNEFCWYKNCPKRYSGFVSVGSNFSLIVFHYFRYDKFNYKLKFLVEL